MMNRLVLSSARLFTLRAAPRVFVATRRIAPTTFSRGFARKADVQEKSEFENLLEEELLVLKATNSEVTEQTTNLRTEMASRFLKQYNFKLSEAKAGDHKEAPFDADSGLVTLTTTVGNTQVQIKFSDRLIDEGAEEENSEEQSEEEPNEDEDSQEPPKGEQPFRVIITRKDKHATFDCYAVSDGSFVVSEMNLGDGRRIPVSIGNWNEDLQRELLQWLDQFGVNENLSYYIHDYLDRRMHHDNYETVKEFVDFVKEK